MARRRNAADDVLDEPYAVRRRIWDACDRDIDRYFAILQERHEQLVREGWREAPLRSTKGQSVA
jgi:hypothetical protein